MKKTILFLSLFCLISLSLGATNYYVTTSGNDNNSGLSGSPWRTISKAVSSVAANAGHVINIGAGTFTESNIISIPSGVSLIGAGSSQTSIMVNHYYNITDFNQWLQETYHPEHFVIQMNGSNQTIKGFSLNGQSRACVGGIYARNAANCIFDDLNVQNFRISGIWLEAGASNTEIKNCYIKNNAMAAQSGDTGNILFGFSLNLSIHDNYIEEQGAVSANTGGYGIKRALNVNACPWDCENSNYHENMQIFNNTIIVPENGAWINPGDGSYAPAIAIECNGGIMKNCRIYNNNINNHISLVGNFNGATSGNACRIDHNNFNLGHGRYAYAVEANVPGLEIDHNFISGGLNPIAMWDGRRTDNSFYDHKIHHNIFYDQWAGRDIVYYNEAPRGGNGFMFYNNTIIDNNGLSRIFSADGGEQYNKVDIRNNIFASTYGSRGDIFGVNYSGTVSNNCFYNITSKGSNNITSNPNVTLSGNQPSPFFQLQSGSPAINAGVVISGVTDGSIGAPDMGAFENGVTAWVVGPQSTLPPLTGIDKYEAESATISGGYIANDWPNYSGTGFWWVPTQGNSITFTVNASAGNQDITCRFGNGNGAARTMSLYVNNTKIRQVSFPAVGVWGTWADKVDNVTLNAGSNTIKYQNDSGDNGQIHIDYILVNAATASFTVSSRGENLPDEGIAKIYDDTKNTKWLEGSATSWVQFAYSSGKIWNRYEIISANDEPTRDPKNWTLQGSNDGSAWTTLSTQSNQTWSDRFVKKTFTFTNTTAYKYYKWNITANNGSDGIQVAELTFSRVTARGDNVSAGEGIDKLCDDITTANNKWLDFNATSWTQVEYYFGAVWNKYEVTSCNDEPTRDPKNWTIQGSNDGATWTTLNTQTNQTWASRNLTKAYTFTNTNAYNFYKWTISANNGATIVQVSELKYSNSGGLKSAEVTTDIGVAVSEGTVKVYPNPSNGIVYIELANSQKSTITVYDLYGRELLKKAAMQSAEQLDLSGYKGLLLIKIDDGKNTTTKTVFINN